MKGESRLKHSTETVSPYIRGRSSVQGIMFCVLAALLPAVLTGWMSFGFQALMLLGITVGTAILAELFCRAFFRKRQTVHDLSAAVTGLLLGLTLPPDFPLWKAAVGSIFAIVCVKQLFGGIGRNFANPAATAKILLMVLFMDDMTVWRLPQSDVIVTQTPLTGEIATCWDLFLGNTAGNLGETSALCILLGALFLWLTGTASPIAPLSCLGSFALLTAIGGYHVPEQLFSGGLMLGACFMTADYTTTPVTRSGKCIFGLGCGILTFLIRHFGGYPEGITFAIVIMNLLTPWIEKLTKPQPFGIEDEPKPSRQKRKKRAKIF